MMSSQMVHSIVMSSLTKKREIRRLHYNLGYWDIKFTKISSSLSLSLSLSFSLTHSLSLTLSLSLSLSLSHTHTHTHSFYLILDIHARTHVHTTINLFGSSFNQQFVLFRLFAAKKRNKKRKIK
jgi:hypothetical protein